MASADTEKRAAELRERIEKDTDKEKQGSAILVRVDRVRAGPNDIQRR